MKLFRNLGIAGILLIFLLVGCDNRSTTHLTYYETQCADPWDRGNNDTEHMANVLQYLSDNGVNAMNIELELEQDSAAVCLACTCLSGMKATIEVDNSDVAEANALGFN